MAISNCLFLSTTYNPRVLLVWCLLARFRNNPYNYLLPIIL